MARVNLTNASSSGSGNRFSSVFNSKYPMNYNPDYMTLFEFEKYEGHESVRIWMYDHWQWSVYASGIYVGLVKHIKLKSKPPSEIVLMKFKYHKHFFNIGWFSGDSG